LDGGSGPAVIKIDENGGRHRSEDVPRVTVAMQAQNLKVATAFHSNAAPVLGHHGRRFCKSRSNRRYKAIRQQKIDRLLAKAGDIQGRAFFKGFRAPTAWMRLRDVRSVQRFHVPTIQAHGHLAFGIPQSETHGAGQGLALLRQ